MQQLIQMMTRQVVDDNDDQVVDDNNDQVVYDNNDQVVDDNDVDQLEGRHFKPGLAAVTSTNTLQRNRVLTLLKKKWNTNTNTSGTI